MPHMRRLLVGLLVVGFGCKGKSEPPAAPPPAPAPAPAPAAPVVAVDAGVPPPYRTTASTYDVEPAVTASAKTYMVSTESAQATAVGKAMLAAGGNAVDAAVATAFALAVAHPTAGNLGGGGFAVVRVAKDKAEALDFRETAPAAASADMYLDAEGKPTKDSLIGHRASGVPGSVAGLYALHKKYGKKPWKDVVAPAIALAHGFVVDKGLGMQLARRGDGFAKFPASAAIWTPGGKPHVEGDRIEIPELVATLQRIADKGADGFYAGETAAAIVKEMKAGGGLITAADLSGYKPIWRAPLAFDYRGYHLLGMPLPSSGGFVIAMTANMLRGTEVGKLPWHGTEHVHRLVEVWRRAFAARNELLGDPAYVKDIPLARLLSTDYADKLAATITDKATPSKDILPLLEGTHTTNLCVVDGNGMAVAMTTTLNTTFGSGVTVAGFLMNNEMDDFTAKPGTPNTFGLVQGAANKIEPGKRMLSSMSPTIVLDDKGDVVMLAGAGGGPRIITAVWQTISNVLDFKMAAAAADAAPRIHHQHLPDRVELEADAIDQDTEHGLAGAGYQLLWGEPQKSFFGAVTTIVRAGDHWEGTSDRRGGGAAAGD